MRILYAIQGTGNGHLSRAHELVPILSKFAQVDTLISGNQSQIKAEFELNYQRTGLTFLSGKNGDISIVKSLKNTHPIDFIREIRAFPVKQYDLVLSDFEPVSAWSALINGVPCIELSHQAGVIHPFAPKPEQKAAFGRYVLHHYVPSKIKFGFHFEAYEDRVFTPVIRKEIRTAEATDLGHYTVYLPGYHDDVLMHFLRQFPVKWEVFSKHANYAYRVDNVFIERLWRSLKYECVYLKSFETGQEARKEIGFWMKFYNTERPHSVFDGLTPKEMYRQGMQESEYTQLKTAA